MRFAFRFASQGFSALRGPFVSRVVEQLLTGTRWGALDYLLVDLPPGTGDVHLTLAQELPLDAALLVTTPQALRQGARVSFADEPTLLLRLCDEAAAKRARERVVRPCLSVCLSAVAKTRRRDCCSTRASAFLPCASFQTLRIFAATAARSGTDSSAREDAS